MPKKGDEELKASAIRLVNDHQEEDSPLTAAAGVVSKQQAICPHFAHPNKKEGLPA